MQEQEKETLQPSADQVLTEEELNQLLSASGGKKAKKKQAAQAPVVEDEPYKEDIRIQAMNQDFAREQLAEARGEEAPVYGLWGAIWKMWRRFFPEQPKRRLSKKKYLLLMLFLGWCGGHRWYQHRWYLASFMTMFCWTGIPLVLCVTDLMEVLPLKADEEGYIMM